MHIRKYLSEKNTFQFSADFLREAKMCSQKVRGMEVMRLLDRCSKDSTSRLSLVYLQSIFGKWYRSGNGAQ